MTLILLCLKLNSTNKNFWQNIYTYKLTITIFNNKKIIHYELR